MEIPVSNRVILSKKTAKTSLELDSGVEIDTNFIFAKIISVAKSNASGFSNGQIVCVPKEKISEIPVLSTKSIEYCCFSHDILYISEETKAIDKSL